MKKHRMLTVYLSHPFTGKEYANRRHARKLAADICTVAKSHKSAIAILNPCDCIRYAEKAKLSYAECIDICLKLLEGCDGLLLTSGWENSKGCVIEAAYAVHCGKPVCLLPEKINTKTLPAKIDIQQNKDPNFTEKLHGLIEALHIKDIPLKEKQFLQPGVTGPFNLLDD